MIIEQHVPLRCTIASGVGCALSSILLVRELRLIEVLKLTPRQTYSNVRTEINLGGLAGFRTHAFPDAQLFLVLGGWQEPGRVGLGLGTLCWP